MAKPSMSMSDEFLREFDAVRDELKRRGELDMETGRSSIVRQLMRDWMDEHEARLDLDRDFWKQEGNVKMAALAD